MRTNLAARELLGRAQARKAQMIALIRRLVEQESPSFQKTAVDQLGRLLAREFEQRGAKVKFHPARKFGDHLQADFPGRGKPVMLLGHFDTVYDLGTLSSMRSEEHTSELQSHSFISYA